MSAGFYLVGNDRKLKCATRDKAVTHCARSVMSLIRLEDTISQGFPTTVLEFSDNVGNRETGGGWGEGDDLRHIRY